MSQIQKNTTEQNAATQFVASLIKSVPELDLDTQEVQECPVSATDRLMTMMKIGLTPAQLRAQIQKTLDAEHQTSYEKGYDQGWMDVGDNSEE